jgi:hypothetical protein
MIITSVNIANSFLQKSFKENVPLTVLKLNKLIYLFFRNYLKETGNIIFSEPFEAWNTGPVLPNVQAKFQSFRKEPVKKFACDITEEPHLLKNEYIIEE